VIRTTALERNEHGTHTSYACGCRCSKCRAAQSRYARERWAVAAVMRGAEPHWKVDAGRVLEHLEVLMAAGWTLKDIAVAVDVPRPTLISIRQGFRRGTSKCWNTVADRVLELER
jgi:hypothetical protein